MNPADHPPFSPAQRAAESPTLWLSLALGSVLIHLVLFILASLVLNRTAKVQLDIAPIAVEFVDPNAVRSTAAGKAIAVRPGKPSSIPPSNTQVQPRPARSQPSAFNQPVEQPLPQQIPQQRVKRRQTPVSPRTQPPDRPTAPPQPRLNASENSRLQEPNLPNQAQERSGSDANSSQGGLSGATPNAGNDALGPTALQSPTASGNQIAQLPQGRSVTVVVSNPQQTKHDRQQQPATPIEEQKTLSIDYPDAVTQVAGHTIRLTVTLQINDSGSVVSVGEPSLLSPNGVVIQQTDLDYIAEQIFGNWKFEPAQNKQGNAVLKPLESNLTITAEVQLP